MARTSTDEIVNVLSANCLRTCRHRDILWGLLEYVGIGVYTLTKLDQFSGSRPNMKISNLPEANKYIREKYREGWTLIF